MGCATGTVKKSDHIVKANIEQININQQKIVRANAKFNKVDERLKTYQNENKILENVTIISQKLNIEQQEFAYRLISNHYLFEQLIQEEKKHLLSQLILVQGQKNQYLFKQGDKGSCFFIIYHGKVQLEINNQIIKIIKQGQSFGDMALMYCAPRSASIKCVDNKVQFIVMKSYSFKKSLRQIGLKKLQKLKEIINKVKIFSFLTNKQKNMIANNLISQQFNQNDLIFHINQPANCFYIVQKGSVRINIPQKQQLILRQSSSFGQSSFYQEGKRSGSAYANQNNTILVSIGRQQIQKCLGESVNGIIYHNIKTWALIRSNTFNNYTTDQIQIIANSFQLKVSKVNNQILSEKGKHPNSIIICLQGSINHQPTGSIFCQTFYGNKQNVLIEDIIKNDQGAYAILDFKNLAKVLQNIKQNKLLNSQTGNKQIIKSNISTQNNKNLNTLQTSKNISSQFDTLEMIKKLGQGQFGQVFLVKDNNYSGALFALKCINRLSIVKQGIQSCILSQRKILETITFPLIVGYVKAYIDNDFIYFMMEFINGVQMFDVIRQIGLLNKTIARYFVGSLLLSLEYLHSCNIIYRDLKPQNSVVGHDGKVYLIDMGTAKLLNQNTSFRTFTIIGTPHYMAPQVFQGKGYSFQTDYWSLGILLYELICGRLPYGNSATDPYAVFAEIIKEPLKFPNFLTDTQAKQVLQTLLNRTSQTRSQNNGFAGIKKMKYFQGFQWDKVITTMKAAYIPKKFRGKKDNLRQIKGNQFIQQFYLNRKDHKYNSNKKGHKPIVNVWNDYNL